MGVPQDDKPLIVLKGKNYYTSAIHTYQTQNNPQQNILLAPTTLPLSQPVFPQAPSLLSFFGKEYDLVEKLCTTDAKISLWELLQTYPTYQEALQKALSTLP